MAISSGNGLTSDGTKPLRILMLKYHQMCSMVFNAEQFHTKCSWTKPADYTFKIVALHPQESMS